VSSCGTSGLFSSVSAPDVCRVPCQVCRTIVCLSYKLPGASPRALPLGGSYSSGLVTCRCLAPAYPAWLVEVCLCMTLSCKAFSQKKGVNMECSRVRSSKRSCQGTMNINGTRTRKHLFDLLFPARAFLLSTTKRAASSSCGPDSFCPFYPSLTATRHENAISSLRFSPACVWARELWVSFPVNAVA
jgi:hypothetical protein